MQTSLTNLKKVKLIKNSYFALIFYKEKEVVYVGTCIHNIPNIFAHNDKDFDSYSVIECADPEELVLTQTELIIKYLPIYNNTLPTNERYMRKSVIKQSFDVTGHEFNKYIRLNKVQPIYQDYYDIQEIFQFNEN